MFRPVQLLTFLLFSSFVLTGKEKDVQSIYELTDDTFYDFLKEKRNVVVLFYQTNCETCSQIEEETEDIMSKVEKKGVHWTFARFNVHKYHHYLKVLHVHEFPRLRFYYDHDFHSTLHIVPEKEEVHKFLTEIAQASAVPKEIKSEVELRALKKEKLAIYLSFPEKNDKLENYVKQLQRTFFKIQVYWSIKGSDADKDLFDEEKKLDFKFLLLRKFDEGNKELLSNELLNPQSVLNVVNTFSHERIQVLDKEIFERIQANRHPFIAIFDHKHDSKNVVSLKSILLEKHYTGLIVVTNLEEPEFGKEFGIMMGVNKSDFPVVMIVNNEALRYQKYKYSGEVSHESINEFLNDHFEGKIPEYLRSQKEIPIENKKITELVSSNYEDFIKNSKSHVFVCLYKEKDYASEVFKRASKELFSELDKQNNIVYAQINAELNDLKRINSKELPQLLLYKLNDKENPLRFHGTPVLDDVIKFLGDHLKAYIYIRPPYRPEDEKEQDL